MKAFGVHWQNLLNNVDRLTISKLKKVTGQLSKGVLTNFHFQVSQKSFRNCLQICFVNIHVTLLNKDFPWPIRDFNYFNKIIVIASSKYFKKTTRIDCF